MQAFQRRERFLHVRLACHVLLARESEPYSTQPLKQISVLCLRSDLECALALSRVRE
jgi:hypothetical protein